MLLLSQEPNPILKPGPNYRMNVTYRKLPDGEPVTVVVTDSNSLEVPEPGIDEKYEVIVQSINDEGPGPKSSPVILMSGPAGLFSC